MKVSIRDWDPMTGHPHCDYDRCHVVRCRRPANHLLLALDDEAHKFLRNRPVFLCCDCISDEKPLSVKVQLDEKVTKLLTIDLWNLDLTLFDGDGKSYDPGSL